MKYLDCPELSTLNSYMRFDCADGSHIRGSIDAYSCKKTRDDKSLQQQRASSAESQSPSPGFFSPGSSPLVNVLLAQAPPAQLARATPEMLNRLIGTLNLAFPDYDFAHLDATSFVQESSAQSLRETSSRCFAEVEAQNSGFLKELWTALDAEICLSESEIFSYVPSMHDADPLVGTSMWCFHYFFYSSRRKKLVFWTCSCSRHCADEDNEDELEMDMGDELAFEMDE